MELDSAYYLLSSTAMDMWHKRDIAGQDNMFRCLSQTHKASFFGRVIFRNGAVPEYRLRDLAENVFLETWEVFSRKGQAGEIVLQSREYAGFYFVMFKRGYLKALEKEILARKAELEFGRDRLKEVSAEVDIRDDRTLSPRTRAVLDQLGANCRELLIWKHIEQLSHDEIAKRRHMDRSSSIKMVSRCGRNFFKHWKAFGQ
jgi:hypothetical protein